MYLPDDFADHLSIDNAAERFTEALELRARIVAAGVPLLDAPDHAAIFCDPPQLVMGPLAAIGYDFGWDTRCYPSWVDERLYINVPGRLREDSEAYSRGWFRHVAAVFPIDAAARDPERHKVFACDAAEEFGLDIAARPLDHIKAPKLKP